MKRISVLFFAVITSLTLSAQSVSPDVIASSGDYFEGSNVSLSWTLGELAVETYTAGNFVLTQGFQQPINVSLAGIDLDVLVYLEGPYSGTEMTTNLNAAGELPLSQPYNIAPWNYAGTESVSTIPNADVVDWVIVELRDAPNASSATSETRIARQAAFLLNNGSVVGLDGNSNLQFANSANNGLFVVVWHRNHLGVLSANALSGSGGNYSYDFSTGIDKAYNGGQGYKLVAASVYGMPGGDFDGDGVIDNADKNAWANNAGTYGYQSSDFDMNNQVANPDKNDVWVENTSLSSQVPD